MYQSTFHPIDPSNSGCWSSREGVESPQAIFREDPFFYSLPSSMPSRTSKAPSHFAKTSSNKTSSGRTPSCDSASRLPPRRSRRRAISVSARRPRRGRGARCRRAAGRRSAGSYPAKAPSAGSRGGRPRASTSGRAPCLPNRDGAVVVGRVTIIGCTGGAAPGASSQRSWSAFVRIDAAAALDRLEGGLSALVSASSSSGGGGGLGVDDAAQTWRRTARAAGDRASRGRSGAAACSFGASAAPSRPSATRSRPARGRAPASRRRTFRARGPTRASAAAGPRRGAALMLSSPLADVDARPRANPWIKRRRREGLREVRRRRRRRPRRRWRRRRRRPRRLVDRRRRLFVGRDARAVFFAFGRSSSSLLAGDVQCGPWSASINSLKIVSSNCASATASSPASSPASAPPSRPDPASSPACVRLLAWP